MKQYNKNLIYLFYF